MAAKHFRTVPSGTQDEAGLTGGWAAYRADDEAAGSRRTRPPAHMAVPAAGPGAAARPASRAASHPASSAYVVPQGERSRKERRHGHGPLVAGIACGAVVAALGLGYALGAHGCTSQATSSETPAQDQVQQQADANQATDAADATSDAQDEQGTDATEPEETTQDASAVLSRLSSLQHAGEDCALPTDGTEVDVLGGWALVAYSTTENADVALSRLTSAAAALTDELRGETLTDSSTAPDGVSQVPAASTPGAIASGGEGTTCNGVELVALGEGGYVVAALSLPMTDGTADMGQAEVLSAASRYAIDGGSYAFSGFSARGIAQTKADTPTLLTGEQIVIRISRPQATTTTTSSGTSGTRSTSTSSTSATSSTGTTRRSASGTGSAYGTGSGSGYGYSYGSTSSTSYGGTSGGYGYSGSSASGTGYAGDTSGTGSGSDGSTNSE